MVQTWLVSVNNSDMHICRNGHEADSPFTEISTSNRSVMVSVMLRSCVVVSLEVLS